MESEIEYDFVMEADKGISHERSYWIGGSTNNSTFLEVEYSDYIPDDTGNFFVGLSTLITFLMTQVTFLWGWVLWLHSWRHRQHFCGAEYSEYIPDGTGNFFVGGEYSD